jgi:hypothetical protein
MSRTNSSRLPDAHWYVRRSRTWGGEVVSTLAPPISATIPDRHGRGGRQDLDCLRSDGDPRDWRHPLNGRAPKQEFRVTCGLLATWCPRVARGRDATASAVTAEPSFGPAHRVDGDPNVSAFRSASGGPCGSRLGRDSRSFPATAGWPASAGSRSPLRWRPLRRLEDRKVLAAVRVDAAAAAAPPRVADERPDVLQHRGVPIAEPFGQPRRPLDVGQEERD